MTWSRRSVTSITIASLVRTERAPAVIGAPDRRTTGNDCAFTAEQARRVGGIGRRRKGGIEEGRPHERAAYATCRRASDGRPEAIGLACWSCGAESDGERTGRDCDSAASTGHGRHGLLHGRLRGTQRHQDRRSDDQRWLTAPARHPGGRQFRASDLYETGSRSRSTACRARVCAYAGAWRTEGRSDERPIGRRKGRHLDLVHGARTAAIRVRQPGVVPRSARTSADHALRGTEPAAVPSRSARSGAREVRSETPGNLISRPTSKKSGGDE